MGLVHGRASPFTPSWGGVSPSGPAPEGYTWKPNANISTPGNPSDEPGVALDLAFDSPHSPRLRLRDAGLLRVRAVNARDRTVQFHLGAVDFWIQTAIIFRHDPPEHARFIRAAGDCLDDAMRRMGEP